MSCTMYSLTVTNDEDAVEVSDRAAAGEPPLE